MGWLEKLQRLRANCCCWPPEPAAFLKLQNPDFCCKTCSAESSVSISGRPEASWVKSGYMNIEIMPNVILPCDAIRLPSETRAHSELFWTSRPSAHIYFLTVREVGRCRSPEGLYLHRMFRDTEWNKSVKTFAVGLRCLLFVRQAFCFCTPASLSRYEVDRGRSPLAQSSLLAAAVHGNCCRLFFFFGRQEWQMIAPRVVLNHMLLFSLTISPNTRTFSAAGGVIGATPPRPRVSSRSDEIKAFSTLISPEISCTHHLSTPLLSTFHPPPLFATPLNF